MSSKYEHSGELAAVIAERDALRAEVEQLRATTAVRKLAKAREAVGEIDQLQLYLRGLGEMPHDLLDQIEAIVRPALQEIGLLDLEDHCRHRPRLGDIVPKCCRLVAKLGE